MLNLKNIITFSLLLLVSNIVYADFSGRWCWENDSKISAFSIVINKNSNMYTGGYYAVAQNGNKIDDNDTAFTFPVTHKNTIKTRLKAGISGNVGLIQLTILNNKTIDWLVLQTPKGELFVPKQAKMRRCH